MYILGINAYHGDSSAALLKDGQLVVALEEERILRVKHWAGLPSGAVKFCLEHEGIGLQDVDYIAVSRNPFARLHKKMFRVLFNAPHLSFISGRVENFKKIKNIRSALVAALSVQESRMRAGTLLVEHHRAHIASSFFASPFEEAAIVSLDGFGDFVSTMVGVGKGNTLHIHERVEFPHSLGIFYTALSQFLGFWNYGDEYKVMGLSAFGRPTYFSEMRKMVKLKKNGFFELDTAYFSYEKRGASMTWHGEEPRIGKLFSNKLRALLGNPRAVDEELDERHHDIAASVQAMYEEGFFHILNGIYSKTKLNAVALAGGCAQNSVANGKIAVRTPFREVYIPPAAHDGGTAAGAAFYAWHQLLGKKRDFVLPSAFLGPEYSSAEIQNTLDAKGVKYRYASDEDIVVQTSRLLASGCIVGWFQGRAEWGPRALGARSILANPCRADMKDTLNAKIKRREPFRPFGASILEEAVSEYFECADPSPYMERVYAVRREKRVSMPAIVHVDGTCRVQTVRKDANRRYYDLISAFGELTGIPVLLNTSFNENEPMVNRPEEATDCFLRTRMDALVIGNYIILRNEQ